MLLESFLSFRKNILKNILTNILKNYELRITKYESLLTSNEDVLLRVRTHKKPCGLSAAICVLRPVLRPVLRHSMPQSAARKLQRAGRIVFNVRVRAIAFMFIHTQHASETIVSVALLVETQRMLKYVQLGAACGLRFAACVKV